MKCDLWNAKRPLALHCNVVMRSHVLGQQQVRTKHARMGLAAARHMQVLQTKKVLQHNQATSAAHCASTTGNRLGRHLQSRMILEAVEVQTRVVMA